MNVKPLLIACKSSRSATGQSINADMQAGRQAGRPMSDRSCTTGFIHADCNHNNQKISCCELLTWFGLLVDLVEICGREGRASHCS